MVTFVAMRVEASKEEAGDRAQVQVDVEVDALSEEETPGAMRGRGMSTGVVDVKWLWKMEIGVAMSRSLEGRR